MWNDLFHLSLSPLDFLIRAIVIYLFVLILLRIGGKRQMGQMGATEFVAVLLISNAVQNSMNGGDNSLLGGMLLATTLVILSAGISFVTYRSSFFSSIFEGTPTLLIHRGRVIRKHMAKERLSDGDLKTLLRKQGLHEIHEIETAILEADGTLTVTKKNEKPMAETEPL